MQHGDLDTLAHKIVTQEIAKFGVVVDDKYLSSHAMQFNACPGSPTPYEPRNQLPGVTAKGVRKPA